MKLNFMILLALVSVAAFANEKAKKKEAPKAKAASAPTFPVRVTEADLDGSKPEFLAKHLVLISFVQKLQLPDGSMTTKPGKVLVIQKDDAYMVGFYRPFETGYVLADKPVTLKNVQIPRESVHPKHNVPCLIAKRQDGQGAWNIYILGGKSKIEPAE